MHLAFSLIYGGIKAGAIPIHSLHRFLTANLSFKIFLPSLSFLVPIYSLQPPQLFLRQQRRFFNFKMVLCPDAIATTAAAIEDDADATPQPLQIKTSKLVSSLLAKDTIRMRNPAEVENKIGSMTLAGQDRLMLISDFDFTLSRYHNTGQLCATTHGLFVQIAEQTNPEFLRQIHDLRNKYVPIEYCPMMSMEDKVPIMEEWWRQSHELIVKHRPTRELLRHAVEMNKQIQLRDGCADFLNALNKCDVPLVLFSAGIGQIIEHIIEFQTPPEQQPFPNIHIISNFMVFSEPPDDVCIGFTEPLIHTFNKNGTVVQPEAPFFHKIANRSSVLLLGDSLGDVHMDVGVESESVVLKIGFLNFNMDTLLERYMEEYDIVLVDDQTMDVPTQLLAQIRCGGPAAEDDAD